MEAVTACNITLALDALLLDAMGKRPRRRAGENTGQRLKSSASLAKVVYIENHSTFDGGTLHTTAEGFSACPDSMHTGTIRELISK